jgi:hypothetical protein
MLAVQGGVTVPSRVASPFSSFYYVYISRLAPLGVAVSKWTMSAPTADKSSENQPFEKYLLMNALNATKRLFGQPFIVLSVVELALFSLLLPNMVVPPVGILQKTESQGCSLTTALSALLKIPILKHFFVCLATRALSPVMITRN